jgi:DnaK suppressor protein
VDTTAVRELLLSRRQELTESIIQLQTRLPDDGSTVPFGKRAGDFASTAVAAVASARTAAELQPLTAEITRALEKLDQGSYGNCDRCGQAIAPARLEAMPWAVLCIDCRAALERARRH